MLCIFDQLLNFFLMKRLNGIREKTEEVLNPRRVRLAHSGREANASLMHDQPVGASLSAPAKFFTCF